MVNFELEEMANGVYASSFPEEKNIKQLKEMGFGAIISISHLYYHVRNLAEGFGIKLIDYGKRRLIDYNKRWLNGNDLAISDIRLFFKKIALAKLSVPGKKILVHCDAGFTACALSDSYRSVFGKKELILPSLIKPKELRAIYTEELALAAKAFGTKTAFEAAAREVSLIPRAKARIRIRAKGKHFSIRARLPPKKSIFMPKKRLG